ncbi:hypothetical protein QAD02_004272 [Eretmocerus hayati]|uniref:Uncharacterized protein n=1 Tax=Eretmocerus hayati TaxID=131215 RepID=A0ACC2NPF4_9HYME|nr:hypothetical protein QAD02_004272 [Eretmocerus hayati]
MSRGPPRKKYNKLANQVGTLSKIVDDIQEEVNLLQSPEGSNEGRSQSFDNQRRRNTNTRPNRSFLQRLRFFRRNRKKTVDSPARANPRAKNSRENLPDRRTNETMTTQKSKRRETAPQSSKMTRFDSNESIKRELKNRRTQTNMSTENILELECFVKTTSAQTEHRNVQVKEDAKVKETKIVTVDERETTPVAAPNRKLRSMCDGCAKTSEKKKDKSASEAKKKKGKCSKHCPYLAKNSGKTRESYKNAQNCCVELCSQVKNLQSTQTKEKLDKDGYPKPCVTKNVVKINKAILSQNPPIIFMPPTSSSDGQEARCQKIECKGACNRETNSSDER